MHQPIQVTRTPPARTAAIALAIGLSAATLSGCTAIAGLPGLTSERREFQTSDTLVLTAPPHNFTQTVSEVGEQLDYDLAGIEPATNTVRFTDNSGTLQIALLNQNRTIALTVRLGPDGRTVHFDIAAQGNFSSATQEAIQERLQEFKVALQQRFA